MLKKTTNKNTFQLVIDDDVWYGIVLNELRKKLN